MRSTPSLSARGFASAGRRQRADPHPVRSEALSAAGTGGRPARDAPERGRDPHPGAGGRGSRSRVAGPRPRGSCGRGRCPRAQAGVGLGTQRQVGRRLDLSPDGRERPQLGRQNPPGGAPAPRAASLWPPPRPGARAAAPAPAELLRDGRFLRSPGRAGSRLSARVSFTSRAGRRGGALPGTGRPHARQGEPGLRAPRRPQLPARALVAPTPPLRAPHSWVPDPPAPPSVFLQSPAGLRPGPELPALPTPRTRAAPRPAPSRILGPVLSAGPRPATPTTCGALPSLRFPIPTSPPRLPRMRSAARVSTGLRPCAAQAPVSNAQCPVTRRVHVSSSAGSSLPTDPVPVIGFLDKNLAYPACSSDCPYQRRGCCRTSCRARLCAPDHLDP
nr:uncharacterized protein LOC111756464 [Cavia porcellus]